jgi:hypothetical protein
VPHPRRIGAVNSETRGLCDMESNLVKAIWQTRYLSQELIAAILDPHETATDHRRAPVLVELAQAHDAGLQLRDVVSHPNFCNLD